MEMTELNNKILEKYVLAGEAIKTLEILARRDLDQVDRRRLQRRRRAEAKKVQSNDRANLSRKYCPPL